MFDAFPIMEVSELLNAHSPRQPYWTTEQSFPSASYRTWYSRCDIDWDPRASQTDSFS